MLLKTQPTVCNWTEAHVSINGLVLHYVLHSLQQLFHIQTHILAMTKWKCNV